MGLNAKCIAALLAACSLQAVAQTWPSKPIKVVVPYPPGGYYDLIARTVGQKFPQTLGQPAVVENRPGGGAIIGTEFTAKSPPDGYTIMVGGIGPHALNTALHADLRYDPVRDFAPIIQVASQAAIVVVNPSFEAKSLRELLALARAKPGAISYASNGIGTGPHLSMELLEAATGVKFNHVPFTGSAQAVTATIGGQTAVMFGPASDVMTNIQAGKLRPLAVSSVKRMPLFAEVPTAIEAGVPDYQFASWFGFFAPAATPRYIVTRLNSEIQKIVRMPDVHDRLAARGTAEVVGGTPEQLGNLVKAEIAKWVKVVKMAGVKAN